MSTKIYEGLKLNENMDFYKINQLVREIRKEADKIFSEEYSRLMMESICEIFDYSLFMEKEELKNYLKTKYKLKRDKFYPYFDIRELLNKDNGFFNLNCNIIFYPLKDKVLCQFFHTNPKYYKLYRKTKIDGHELDPIFSQFEEYGYWNNSDQPDNISEEEWEQREEDWNEALRGIGIPLINGFSKKIVEVFSFDLELPEKDREKLYEQILDEKKYLNSLETNTSGFFVQLSHKELSLFQSRKDHLIPSKENRAKNISKKILRDKFEKENSNNYDDICDYLSAYKKYSKSEEFKRELDLLSESYMEKIREVEYFKEIDINELYK